MKTKNNQFKSAINCDEATACCISEYLLKLYKMVNKRIILKNKISAIGESVDKKLTESQKRIIDKGLKKTIKEYGETLKLLGTG